MFPPTSHLPESPYSKYKRLGRSIFGKLDPNGLLRGVKHHRAKQIVQNLVRKLADNLRDTVSTELLEAIRYRTEWAKCYKRAPKYMQANHKTYIDFLKDIQKQLSAYKADEPAALAKEEQPPTEPQPEEDEEKGGSADDEETGLTSEQAGDAETHLTLDHADFLVFLASLMALAREAAKLWEEVARDKLPIWTASTCRSSRFNSSNGRLLLTVLIFLGNSDQHPPPRSRQPDTSDETPGRGRFA